MICGSGGGRVDGGGHRWCITESADDDADVILLYFLGLFFASSLNLLFCQSECTRLSVNQLIVK